MEKAKKAFVLALSLYNENDAGPSAFDMFRFYFEDSKVVEKKIEIMQCLMDVEASQKNFENAFECELMFSEFDELISSVP